MVKDLSIFCYFIFFTFLCIFSFQNFLFNIVSQCKHINFRYNCSLQIFGLLNFFGSFFWCYVADKRLNHNNILALNIVMYVLLVLVLLFAKNISAKILQITLITTTTICREFTLGGILPVFFALTLNYMKKEEIPNSRLMFVNISSILGHIAAMFLPFAISYLGISSNDMLVSLVICVSSGILSIITILYKAPRFVEHNETQYNSNKNEILYLFSFSSLVLYYVSTIVMGIYKCIISNFVITFLQLNNFEISTIKLLMAIRHAVEVLAYLFLLYLPSVPDANILIVSVVLSALSITCYLYFELTYSVLVICEILKGTATTLFVFTSVVIFNSYATRHCYTQAQGMRNSAYNGISCVLFGVISLLFIQNDVKDPRTIVHGDNHVMKHKMLTTFRNSYYAIFIMLLVTVIPASTAKFLKSKHK